MTAIRHAITMIATSRADDVAYRTLRDVAEITADIEDARIVGGHMTSILLHAFPVGGAAARRTADADAALSSEVAGSGDIHQRLERASYAATSGNHYELRESAQDVRAVDLLVPSNDAVFRTTFLGERAFDATPGLRLALAAEAVTIDITAVLTNQRQLQFTVRVPPVEHAVVLKAYALRDRSKAKDLADLHGLLTIAWEHRGEPNSIGGWRFNEPGATGSRRDAAQILDDFSRRALQPQLRALFEEALVEPERMVFLTRSLITPPS